MRIVCQQLSPTFGDFEANRRASVAAIREAVEAGGQVVVLPELTTSGYVFKSREEAEAVAIGRDHPIFGEWAAEIARAPGGEGFVFAGFCELGDDGLLYNSAAIVDPSGLMATYRKTHLWDREKLFFTPGVDLPPVLRTPLGRIGVLVCYDLEFPELTRTLALHGAELIVVCTNWPLVEHPAGEHAPEVVIAMAAARTNRIFIACCDRAGVERGQEWNEATSVVDENGWVIATVQDGTAIADVDLRRATHKRLTSLADAFADRRPELYSAVVSANP